MELDLTKDKSLLFDIEVTGLDTDQIGFVLRIDIDGIEYGFRGSIEHGKIKIVIPAFNKFLKTSIDLEKVYNVRLDVFDNKFLVCPWKDTVKFIAPTIQPTATAFLRTQEGEHKLEDSPMSNTSLETNTDASVVPELQKSPKKKKKIKKVKDNFYLDYDRFIESLYSDPGKSTKTTSKLETIKKSVDGHKSLECPKKKTLSEEEAEVWIEGELTVDQILKMVRGY